MKKAFLLFFYLFILFNNNFLYSEIFNISSHGNKGKDRKDDGDYHSLAWLNNIKNWGEGIGKIGSGDTVNLFGEFKMPPGKPAITIHGNGKKDNEIIIKFAKNSKITAPYFGTDGAILIKGKEYVIIDGGDNGIIESTDNGSPGFFSFSQKNSGINLTKSNHCIIKNIAIKNIYQAKANEKGNHHSRAVYLTSCNNIHVQNSNFYYMAQGVSITLYDNENIFIHDNTISRIGAGVFCGIGDDGYSGNNICVYRNIISDTTDWGYNDGIKFFGRPGTTDPLSNVKVYSNIIGPKISYPNHPATAWILIDQGWILTPEIYNNLLIGDINDNAANAYITIGGNGHNTGKTVSQNSKIYNNTIISNYKGLDIGILIGKRSVGHKIYNNIFYFAGKLTAIYINDNESKIQEIDNNCYYNNSLLFFNSKTEKYDFKSWQKTLNFDKNSILANPLLNPEYKPASKKSPVVDAGKTLPPPYWNIDQNNSKRPQGGGWDIGAFEYLLKDIDS